MQQGRIESCRPRSPPDQDGGPRDHQAVAALGITTAASEVGRAIRNALGDPDGYVRITAIQAIQNLQLRSLLDVLVEMQPTEVDSMIQRNLEIALSAQRPGS